jgi:hypothetical protein
VLAFALGDADPTVAAEAGHALRSLKTAEAVDALCELAIADPARPVATIVKERDYQCSSASRRCLLFLLTDQIARYFELDFETQYLKAEYRVADETLKRHIGEAVRKSRNEQLLELFRDVQITVSGTRVLSEREAEINLDVLKRNRSWSELFALLRTAPLSTCVHTLDVLNESGWTPDNPADAAMLKELLEARQGIGDIPASPPAPDVALGPEFGEWIQKGRKEDVTRIPEDVLRRTLRDSAPPEAVAALAALVSTGRASTEDTEAARTHRHWLVRLAALALCELAPQLLAAEAPSTGGGGELWLKPLAPTILDASLYRRHALKVMPDGIEALQKALSKVKSADSQRIAWLHFLEALARHIHRGVAL